MLTKTEINNLLGQINQKFEQVEKRLVQLEEQVKKPVSTQRSKKVETTS